MPFTLLLVFLVLKKKSFFPLSSDLAAETLSCTGCLPSACRLCAPADKDCATGNHYNDVPNSLHRVIAEETFRSWRAFKFCNICSRHRIVFVCVCMFLISTWSKESLYSFVILWWSHHVLINSALYYLCSAKVMNHELRSPFCTSAEWLATGFVWETSSLWSICWINGLVKLWGRIRLSASFVQVFSIIFVVVYFVICKFVQTP